MIAKKNLKNEKSYSHFRPFITVSFSADDKAFKGSLRAATPGKGKGGRGKSSNKDDKKGKEKDKHEESIDDEEDIAPAPPLTIHVQVKLHYWKSAREAAQEFLPQRVPSHTGAHN